MASTSSSPPLRAGGRQRQQERGSNDHQGRAFATSHDVVLAPSLDRSNTIAKGSTRFRRASISANAKHISIPNPTSLTESHLSTITAQGGPSRPPKSPLRPRLPSLHRPGTTQRQRQESGLSVSGIEYLRGVLHSFRASLRPESQEQVDPPGSPAVKSGHKPADSKSAGPRQRLSSLTLPRYLPHQPSPNHSHTFSDQSHYSTSEMSLAEQRSSQRLLDTLLDELRPGTPRGTILPSPSPSPPLPRPVDRARRYGGHRRTHSLPDSVPSAVGHGNGRPESVADARIRTVSGAALGRPLGITTDDETRSLGGVMTAPVSPVLKSAALPSVPFPPLASDLQRKSSASQRPELDHLSPPRAPIARPDMSLPSPPPLSPVIIGADPTPPLENLATPDRPITQPPHPPPTSPLPPTPTPQSTPSKSRHTTPQMHPFAAVVAMMESGDPPSRRRSRTASQEMLASPTMPSKVKARDEGERPSEGRQQTPRRGLIGPGGIIPRIASKASLGKLRSSQLSLSPTPKPTIVAIPPTSPPTSPFAHTPMTATSATFLRPAPPVPISPNWPKPRYALSTSHIPSPSPSRQPTPSPTFAPRSGTPGLPQPGTEMIEIPRFKKRELNLEIVRRRGVAQKAAWVGLWIFWLMSGLLSLFLDVNVIYILVQCTIHPSFDTNSARTWQFATAAYAVLWAISTLAVWLGWELGYEYWRRWRLPRPAIEPLYLSLPASLHLSLYSFNHFTFLLHIRLSPLGTPHARDVIPETFYSLFQLLPGLLPLIPRAAIAVVLLISFWRPETDVEAPYGGAVDQTGNRDSNFFRSDAPGELTSYAKGVLLTSTIWVAVRLVVVIVSGIGLWTFSDRPFGGVFGSTSKRNISGPPSTPKKRKPKSSLPLRDPSQTHSPQKSWIDHENAFDWAWKERTRSRVQDAFELCMIRRSDQIGSFLTEGGVPWGRTMEQRVAMTPVTPMAVSSETPARPSVLRGPITTEDFLDHFVEGTQAQAQVSPPVPSAGQTNSSLPGKDVVDPARRESTLDPTVNTNPKAIFAAVRPAPSRIDTTASNSATDLFYTPIEGNTPLAQSVAEGIHKVNGYDRAPNSYDYGNGRPVPAPPSAYKKPPLVTEFGVKSPPRQSEDSSSAEGDDESTGLLSATTLPRNSITSRDRSSSAASRDRQHSHSTHSSGPRPRAHTTSSPHLSLSRARSSSITMLREKVGAAQQGLARRARSGTMLGSPSPTDGIGGGGQVEARIPASEGIALSLKRMRRSWTVIS